jgi:uncharacterized protein (DUF305 family)
MLVVGAAIVLVAVLTDLPERGGSAPAEATVGAPDDGGHGDEVRVADEAGFIAAMIPHHQEAVDAATALLAVSERPEARALAEEIVQVQREEIALLEAWLAEHYPGAQPDADYRPMMRDLSGLSAAEADATFVADMIMHHEMAVAMAEAYLALDAPRRAEVEALARDVVVTQSEEIERMHTYLDAWGVPDHGGH